MNLSKRKDQGTEIPGCLRRLSNFERYLLWSAENNMALVARILGGVKEDDLRRAIDSLIAVHPLMNARIIADMHHNVWFSTDHAQRAALRIVPRTSEESWFDEVRKEYLVPFKPSKGPLIRFVLVYSEQVSELIAFAQHSICDGISLANLFRDIFAIYDNQAFDKEIIRPPVTTDYLKHHDSFSLKSIDKAAVDHYNDEWRKSPHYFLEEDFLCIYNALAKKIRHEIVILQLEPDETADLVARCRENGTTVTSALTAAFLSSYQEIRGQFPENRRTIQVPFDLRKRFGVSPEDFLGFFVGAFKFPFAYDFKRSFWENAHELQEIIRKRADALDTSAIDMEAFDPTLVDAFTNCAPYVNLLPEAFSKTESLSEFARDKENTAFEISRKAVENLPGTISSNIGRLQFPETYESLRLDRMFFVAPASEAFPLFIVGVSLNDRLAFSLNYVEHVGEGDSVTKDMIRIRNRALEYLGFPERARESSL